MPNKKSKRRVVITGIGIISPIGTGKQNFTDALLNGVSGVKRLENFGGAKFSKAIAGAIPDFEPSAHIHTKNIPCGRSAQMAVAASDMALEDACLTSDNFDPDRTGVIIGSSVGGLQFYETEINLFGMKGRVNPYAPISIFAGAVSSEVSIYTGARGPSHTLSNGCTASTDAIGSAFRSIRTGETDVVISGGAESPITPFIMAGFRSIHVLSRKTDIPEKACRPFDALRDGMVIAEGACIFIIENLEHALARQAPIYAEIFGYASTNDACHMLRPEASGKSVARCMAAALQDAGIGINDVQYINAHGTSTIINDRIETQAIKAVFKNYAENIPASAVKSMTGHAIGASGGIEMAAAILGMQNGFMPPTINLENVDPECDLDYVPNQARKCGMDVFLKNSIGFGGKNAMLVVGRCT
ncbi:beta-ketoacyl-[acyl-carrier-protein] synthase family protein [Desulfococcaceae bacterium HSG7]|nr:beta-ketoacyl-[acyl-carrier-protein] synthase family protein [Desulfococcaceae bacterium HSG7]